MSPPRRFSLWEIETATNRFAKELGAGAYGTVYLGNISGKQVAVKRIKIDMENLFPTFQKEIDLLSTCNHANIISLVGYSDEGGEKIIVYEFMSNGTLYDHLYEHQEGTPRMTVEQRLQICLGVATGLKYLHSGTHSDIIIHSDLKAENILLNGNLEAKIADFGLSRTRVLGPFSSKQVTNSERGTPGYIAPECFEANYKLSRKSDVYAFGVVLLESLCERRGWENLTTYAIHWIMKGELEKHTPDYVEENFFPDCVRACENLIRDCLEHDQDKRPTMKEVVDRLQSALKLQKQHGHDWSQATNQRGKSELLLNIPKALSSKTDRVVLYHTSSGMIVKSQEACQEVRQILDTYGKRVDERDLYLHREFVKEIQDIFRPAKYTLPQLFIGGKYIGGVDEVRKLHWSGELKKKLERLPKRDYPSFCNACSNTRFVSRSMCQACCFWKND
ncbi:putative receptor-like protein kinase [Artemisia annua]|uniref:Putative receptor-like protein kinase n=1 Tax=Artemisia annua TaxID=35608 RepID=A0A2U1M693_ARTAN|nr:putative receptor-like protein kinase [Artemisia annua]